MVHKDKDAHGKVWRSERAAFSFARAFTLPDNANTEGITASIDNGCAAGFSKGGAPRLTRIPWTAQKRSESAAVRAAMCAARHAAQPCCPPAPFRPRALPAPSPRAGCCR
jgi:hypothetical protein